LSFLSPIFCAIGLNTYLERFTQKLNGSIITALIIISLHTAFTYKGVCPTGFGYLFPKGIEFMVTADEPEETRKLIEFIDENIQSHPALIFDSEESSSSILYVPFRTKLAPPEKLLVSGYNVPNDYEGLRNRINKFMKTNESGIIMFRKSPTLMNIIFSELF
jgi:hypothetical protein